MPVRRLRGKCVRFSEGGTVQGKRFKLLTAGRCAARKLCSTIVIVRLYLFGGVLLAPLAARTGLP